MKKLLLSVLLLALSVPAMALNAWRYMACSGTDTAGRPVHLSGYADSSVVNINGDTLRIVGTTRNGQGVVTESFITTNGVLVYDSLVPTSKTSLNIYQFNAVTEALLAQARLNCNFRANNSSRASVFGQRIFNGLKYTELSGKDVN